MISQNIAREYLQDNQGLPRIGFGPIARWPLLQYLLWFCLFETAFYFAYRYGMSFSQACAAPFWFPDSVLLCALLLSRPRHWWLFVLAPLPIRLFVGLTSNISLWFLLAAFAIDSAKGLLTAAMLRRFIKNPIRLETVREFAVFCLFAVLLIPAASAFGGAAIRYSLGYAYWPAWEQWFMGNALAHLVVTPAIFYLVLGFPWNVPAASLKRWVEGGLLTVGLIVTGFMAFSTGAGEVGFTEPRFYAPVPFLFWAALRFGMLGAAGAITIIAFLSVEAALMDRRPFSGRSPAETALALQTVSVVARGSALSGRHPRRAEKEGRGFAARERSVESRNYQLADKPRRHPRSVGLHHCHQRSMAEVCRFGWCSNGRNQGRR